MLGWSRMKYLRGNSIVSTSFKENLDCWLQCQMETLKFSPVRVRGNSLAWKVPEWQKIETNSPLVNCQVLTVNKN